MFRRAHFSLLLLLALFVLVAATACGNGGGY
jgi:hypothetical protein